MRIRLFLALIFLVPVVSIFAQEKSKIKFGKIGPEDFQKKTYEIDSSADAVIIADIGSTEIVGNYKGSFSLEFKTFRRAHILNKNGYEVANVEIPIYTDGRAEEELTSLKAYTYNLENGKVVETKLDVKEGVFKDKIDKNRTIKKFTFPNIKEGSIIEYEYKLKSDFIFNLQPWDFQGEYPRLWSEYTVSMPEFYYYVTLSQGYQQFFIKDRKDRSSNFSITEDGGTGASQRSTFTANVADYRWVMKDVPAMKEESYTSTIENHISKVEFQLAELRHPYVPKNVMGNWADACHELLIDEDFGSTLSRDNGWLNDAVKEATVGVGTDIDKVKRIFAYVRDHITCTGIKGKYLSKSLKNVLKERNGTEAEVNLLLTAMLLKAGFAADPVMLSTRSHGYTYAMYPLLNRFNYIVSRLSLGDKYFFLDASKPRMGFGKLGYEAYNGHARVIDGNATPIELVSDSLVERKLTSVFVINDEKGNIAGSVQQTPGYYESYNLRNTITEKGKEQFFNDIRKGFNAEIEITKSGIDSLDNYDVPLRINYEFGVKSEKEDIIYLNPILVDSWKENPFKSAQRFYPVEMPYAVDETYILRLDVPQGYVIDELPKQMVLKLNEQDDGMFEYRLSESGGTISLRSRIVLKRAYYLPEEYEMLREFFNIVVKKHNEQIVFKKKK
jgi:hypothetical protein